jgi:excisionase family DNA binding protein
MEPLHRYCSYKILVGFYRFSLVFLDTTCYIRNRICTRKQESSRNESGSEMTMQQERWLSVEEIAAHMGVNPDTVYKWIERRKLPAHRMGRLWKFKATEVDEWVRRGKAGGDAKKA